ncbi:MAG: hypothetical protein HY908_27250 [Myxococcales bacterium]|nr:hypothetical protein [Myxococcales bacterium]
MSTKNPHSIVYFWTRIDQLAVEAHRAYATPYSVQLSRIQDPPKQKGQHIDLKLASVSDSYDTFVTKRFLLNQPKKYAWRPLPPSIAAKVTGSTTLGELCGMLAEKPDQFPAEWYDWAKLDAPMKSWFANVLVDHWDNSEYRSALMDKWPCGEKQTVVGPVDGVPVVVGATKLTTVLGFRPIDQARDVPPGDSEHEVETWDYDTLERRASELAGNAMRVLDLVDKSEKLMRERLAVVGLLEALDTLMRAYATNISTPMSQAPEMHTLTSALLERGRKLAFETPLPEVRAQLRNCPPALAAAMDDVFAHVDDIGVEIARLCEAIRVDLFESAAFRQSCQAICSAEIASQSQDRQRFQSLCNTLHDAAVWGADALAYATPKDSDIGILEGIAARMASTPAKAAADVKGETAFEVIVSVVGPRPRKTAVDFSLGLLKLASRADSLSMAMLRTYAAWELPRAAMAVLEGRSVTAMEDLAKKVLDTLDKHADSAGAVRAALAAGDPAAMQAALWDVRDKFAKDVSDAAMDARSLKGPYALLELLGFMGAIYGTVKTLGKDGNDWLTATVKVTSFVSAAAESVRFVAGNLDKVLRELGNVAAAARVKVVGAFVGHITRILGVFSGFLRLMIDPSIVTICDFIGGFFSLFGAGCLGLQAIPFLNYIGLGLQILGGIIVFVQLLAGVGPPIESTNQVALCVTSELEKHQFFYSVLMSDDALKKTYHELKERLPKALLPFAQSYQHVREGLRAAGFDQATVNIATNATGPVDTLLPGGLMPGVAL